MAHGKTSAGLCLVPGLGVMGKTLLPLFGAAYLVFVTSVGLVTSLTSVGALPQQVASDGALSQQASESTDSTASASTTARYEAPDSMEEGVTVAAATQAVEPAADPPEPPCFTGQPPEQIVCDDASASEASASVALNAAVWNQRVRVWKQTFFLVSTFVYLPVSEVMWALMECRRFGNDWRWQ